MRCPQLHELPSPPPGKHGWPWTVESPQLPATQPDGNPWPRISIVTPSFNQPDTIEETIRSILLQGYPDLEYIVMDGGSKPEVTAIIEKYRPWMAKYESGPDGGQAAGINKGMSFSTGVLANWINSDDFLQPRALHKVAIGYTLTSAELLVGERIFRTVGGDYFTGATWHSKWGAFAFGWADFPQDATFFTLDLYRRLEGLNPKMVYMFDTEFFYRALKVIPKLACISAPISIMTIHGDIKTLRADDRKEGERKLVDASRPKSLQGRLFQTFCRLRIAAAYTRVMQFLGQGTPVIAVTYDVNREIWVANTLVMP